MTYYHILALDGGGIRGLLTAVLLQRLEAARPGLLAQVDLFAGSSTGGILALGLAAGFTPTEARELYEGLGKVVFADSPFDNWRDLGHALGAQYTNGPLKAVLTAQFGDLRLGDLPRKVLISAFDLDNGPDQPAALRTWKPKFFHNYPGPGSDADERVVDVALRTSAAPSYFPLYQGYIDGGVVAGNPSMAALAQALEPTTGRQAQSDVTLLSVGTGRNNQFLTAQDNDWGWLQWAPHIIDILLDGNSGVADYECRQLLGDRYHRLNPLLPERINLDDISKTPRLAEIGERAPLDATLAWLHPEPEPRAGRGRFAGWV
ncbi:MAG: patatin-like phospholipase family protein [Anaerolineales bacterium]|nr:patatin-like phospholipase family protein [Anaerolineales bacterium]